MRDLEHRVDGLIHDAIQALDQVGVKAAKRIDRVGAIKVVLALQAAGITAIPGSPGAKKPCVKWQSFQYEKGRPPEERLRSLWQPHPAANPLMLMGETSGIVVLDADSAEAAEVLRAEFPAAPWAVVSRRGLHIMLAIPAGVDPKHVRNQAHIVVTFPSGRRAEIDVRGQGGYTCGPFSLHKSGHVYTPSHWPWTAADRAALPVLDLDGWKVTTKHGEATTFRALAEEHRKRQEPPPPQAPLMATASRPGNSGRPSALERARAYAAKVPGAVSGNGGDNATFQLAARLVRGFVLDDGQALEILREWNTACQPPWSEGELVAKVRSARATGSEPVGGLLEKDSPRHEPARATTRKLVMEAEASEREPGEDEPEEKIRETDVGNALRLVSRHGDRLRYSQALGWLVWDDRRWQADETGSVIRLARDTIRSIFTGLSSVDPEKRMLLFKHATRSEGEPRIMAMTKLARSDLAVAARVEDFDRNPWTLCVANGTIDLISGALRPHDRRDLMTKLVPIAFDPAAPCPTWERFLSQIMGGASDLVAFLARAIGYSLTGETRDHAIFFLHGSGSNGKTTAIEILRALLGDYGRGADFETFLTRDRSSIREDLARLRGARLVTAAEAPEGRRFDETALKALTGGDVVTARALYSASFEYRPQFKLWLSGNHRPRIVGQDEGIWRRFHLVPFSVRFHDDTEANAHLPAERRKDPTLPARLAAELPGILAWAVRGCLEWQRVGLHPPAAVRAATSGYRAEMDQLGDFVETCCVTFPNSRVGSSELYAAYSKWCQESGERAASRTTFGTRLGERPGIGKSKDRHGRMCWLGIGLARADDGGYGGLEAISGNSSREGSDGEKLREMPLNPPYPPSSEVGS